jgi:putative transcriptional regulator
MANELGNLIRSKRRAKGWTQAQLAQQLGTTQVAVSDWETGRTVPSKLKAAADLLGITEDDIRSAIAARITDDPVQRELMATTKVSPDARDALLTLYREAVKAHRTKNDES